MKNNQKFFESVVVQNHPKTQAIKKQADKRRNRVQGLIMFALFLVICDIIAIANILSAKKAFERVSYFPAQKYEDEVVTVLLLTLCIIPTVVNTKWFNCGWVASDLCFWRDTVAEPMLGPVVEELREVGKLMVSISPAEHIFDFDLMEAWYWGERSLVTMALLHLDLENRLGEERLRTWELREDRDRRIKESREKIQMVYDRLRENGIITDRGGISFFFKAATHKNEWPERELFAHILPPA